MKKWMPYALVLLAWVVLAGPVAGASAPTTFTREPVVQKIDKKKHAAVRERIEFIRDQLPQEFHDRHNFAWAVIKIDGVDIREYYSHSGIQSLEDMSDKAGRKIQEISVRPEHAQFETLCVNRNNVVDGPDCWNRRVDTEFKIIEHLMEFMPRDTNVTGRIGLYTDLPPCASCLHVMRQFLQRYPNVQMDVLYGEK